ncbi:conserved hypothetical protein [Gloeothece citriformis PCC 7424]|uniref:Transposase (putative) YhgA-like domain-containing protein n=1 Tax=Gloeothece citriformis (strain PCC 7424) TaxID=65393 RepID=B7KIZ9_GLOC7|nr:hypothetical protein [Gloeothece citriformis]ACK70835.1 conserved hypothetical protein [Gloeothece citriformis PCC 7424]
MSEISSDYDSAWKEALTTYFEAFLQFCFPQVHRDIDWSLGYENLDIELQELIRDSETGRRLADKLVKVYLNSSEPALVLIHVEVQGQTQSNFAQRMYLYNHRLFDRYQQQVFSLGVLGDDDPNWRPDNYGYSRWGFESFLRFPTLKLLDYKSEDLETSTNPFAIIISAHLQTQITRGKAQERFQSKIRLVRRLFESGYDGEKIRQLFRFIEWMMALPIELEQNFKQEVQRIQEEKKMPYIVSFELDGMVKASRSNVIDVLETRFETIGEDLAAKINQIEDLERLRQLLKQAVLVGSVSDFEQLLSQQ